MATPPPRPAPAPAPRLGSAATAPADAAIESARAALEAELIAPSRTRDDLHSILGRRWNDATGRDSVEPFVERYLQAAAAAETRLRRRLAARLEAAFAWNATLKAFEPHPGPELVEFERERALWNIALDDAERDLVRSLDGIPPSDGGAPRGWIVAALAGDRDEAPLSDPVAAIDLDELLGAVGDAAPMLRSLPEFDAWRRARADAMRARRVRLDRLRIDRADALTELGPFVTDLDDPRRAAFDRAMARIEAERSTLEADLAEATWRTLARLRSTLAPEASAALDRAVASRLHPEVLDEERSMQALAAALLADPALSPDARQALAAVAGQFEARLSEPRALLIRALAARDEAERAAWRDPQPMPRIMALEREREQLSRRAAHRRALLGLGRDLQRLVPTENGASIDLAERRLQSLMALERRDAWTSAAARAEIDRLRRGSAPAAEEALDGFPVPAGSTPTDAPDTPR